MWRPQVSGLMLGVLALGAVGGHSYAAETIVKATSSIKGEGRFYRATDQLVLFSGYFQGNVELESSGDLQGAGLVFRVC